MKKLIAFLAVLAVFGLATAAQASATFDGHTWYSGSGSSVSVNGSGELEISAGTNRMAAYTNFTEQDLSDVGDIASKSYQFKFGSTSGNTASQLRFAILDAEGDAYRTSDGAGVTDAAWANNPTAADDYLGYQVRIYPELASTATGDSIYRRRDNQDTNLMQSSSRWSAAASNLAGHDMAAGTFYDLELKAERTATGVDFSWTLNGVTHTISDTSAAGQPQAIDALAIYTNSSWSHGLITLAQPAGDPIPEPAGLAGLGLLGVAVLALRRRRA